MGGEGMGGNMPSDCCMPDAGTSGSVREPMAAPPDSDMMGHMRRSMQGRPGMSNMTPASRLPGFPGAASLYHAGATRLFLGHPQRSTLSAEQQSALSRIHPRHRGGRKGFHPRPAAALLGTKPLAGSRPPPPQASQRRCLTNHVSEPGRSSAQPGS